MEPAPAIPAILGILNVTPDSFSDGGRHFGDVAESIAAGCRMAEEGAALVDVGGESTRPGAAPVPAEEELRRVLPVVEGLVKAGVAVSIDTRKAAVMRAATSAGATMLNDVSALLGDRESLAVAAASRADVVLMHMPGTPATMQALARYGDVVEEVLQGLRLRIDRALDAGIDAARLVADPGIGFGKTTAHNLSLLAHLESFHRLGVRLMLGASRKAMIPALAGPVPHEKRLAGSIAMALRGAAAGVSYVRVHDVAETRQALLVWQAMAAAGAGADKGQGGQG